jgi:nucleotide-binding universal stress UspA family protein
LEGAGAVYAENQAIQWIVDLAKMPEGSGGVFVAGGTAGNLSALLAARMERLSPQARAIARLACVAGADFTLRLACELVQGIPGGSLTGVHVSRQDITPSRGGRTPGDDVLQKAIQRARSFGVEMKGVHLTGDIGRGVCAAVEEAKADLVVIASQDRRPLVARGLVDLDKLLGSSVSDYIRVHAPAPVLLVREPEGRAR